MAENRKRRGPRQVRVCLASDTDAAIRAVAQVWPLGRSRPYAPSAQCFASASHAPKRYRRTWPPSTYLSSPYNSCERVPKIELVSAQESVRQTGLTSLPAGQRG